MVENRQPFRKWSINDTPNGATVDISIGEKMNLKATALGKNTVVANWDFTVFLWALFGFAVASGAASYKMRRYYEDRPARIRVRLDKKAIMAFLSFPPVADHLASNRIKVKDCTWRDGIIAMNVDIKKLNYNLGLRIRADADGPALVITRFRWNGDSDAWWMLRQVPWIRISNNVLRILLPSCEKLSLRFTGAVADLMFATRLGKLFDLLHMGK